MMEIISVGADELSEYDLESLNTNRPLHLSIELLIYSYEHGGYEGSGRIVYKDNEGTWHYDGLSHCSCNGPIGNFNPIGYDLEQLVALLERDAKDYDGQYAKDILIQFYKSGILRRSE